MVSIHRFSTPNRERGGAEQSRELPSLRANRHRDEGHEWIRDYDPRRGELQVRTRFLVTPLSRYSVVHRRSSDLLRRLDDDPVRPADVAKPVDILVLRKLADEFGAVSPKAVQDISMPCTANAT